MGYVTTEIPAKDIKANDIIVSYENPDETLVAWDDAQESSVMPGLLRIETAFGVLYMDNEATVWVNREV